MHGRKGSFVYSPSRSRAGARWSSLLLFIFVVLLTLHRYRDPTWFLPTPPRPTLTHSCPIHPPSPPLASPDASFDWGNLPQAYPIENLERLPSKDFNAKLPRIQHDFATEGSEDNVMRTRRQASVKEAFQRSWASYREHAWKKDELMPISGRSKQSFGGWGATLVDSLDTLWIMGLRTEFDEAVAAISDIDFAPKNGELNMFETTIRYLGGLLAAYDLSGCEYSVLLNKAMELGDMIYKSFDTPNHMPVTRWNSESASSGERQEPAKQAILAELASSSLEFTRLSQLTGDMKYYDLVARISSLLVSTQNLTRIPGLWPVGLDLQTEDLISNNEFTLGAKADSAYEYLPKSYQLLHGTSAAQQYRTMFESAMSATITHLLFRPITPNNADILVPTSARVFGNGPPTRDHTLQQLSCFLGGTLALGSRLVQNSTYLPYAQRVTEACIWAYQAAPHGIMPEVSTLLACSNASPEHNKENCTFNPDVWPAQAHPGFQNVRDPRYLLRPEAIESVFYMYRITGEQRYQDVAWEMFEAVEKATRTELANAAVKNVMLSTENGQRLVHEDSMESFWLSETLKYFYLIFSEPEVVSLDEWVLNTEAHPLRVGL